LIDAADNDDDQDADDDAANDDDDRDDDDDDDDGVSSLPQRWIGDGVPRDNSQRCDLSHQVLPQSQRTQHRTLSDTCR